MNVKLIEIRDRGTLIPAMAIHLRNRDAKEFFLLRHAGYSAEAIGGREGDAEPYIILCKLVEVQAEYDSFGWANQRTMGNAHRYIIEHWNDLTSGDVVDVEYALGETKAPKVNEMRR